jgi:CheY-like chemotaxis protein
MNLTMNKPNSKNTGQAIHSIILADDDRDDQFFFKEVFSGINPSVQVEIAEDGVELLHLLTHQVPDIIFLDLNIPVNNGLQCLKEIRNNPAFQHVPVVILSSYSRPNTIKTAYNLGANLFFIKPFKFTDLKAALKVLLTINWTDPHQVKEQLLAHEGLGAFIVK